MTVKSRIIFLTPCDARSSWFSNTRRHFSRGTANLQLSEAAVPVKPKLTKHKSETLQKIEVIGTKTTFKRVEKRQASSKMTGKESDKKRKQDASHNSFVCPIVYKNEIPPLAVDCKFLPCCKDILEYTEEPVTFDEIESKYEHRFKGLNFLFDIDLVNQSSYENHLPKQRQQRLQMEPKDAALLADIEPLHAGSGKPRPSRAQECSLMFAKERAQVPRPRTGLQRAQALEAKDKQRLEPISLEQQREMVNKTFEQIKKPVLKHPTKPRSNARPVSVQPFFPDTELKNFSFVQMQFDIPPSDNSKSLIKDCGNYHLNFNVQKDVSSSGDQIYLSDQRYKEEKTAENSERGERFILREKDGKVFYINVDKHIKLRRERPRPLAMANKCLLQVRQVGQVARMETELTGPDF